MSAYSGSPWIVPFNVGQYFGGGNINQQGGNYTPGVGDVGTVISMTSPSQSTVTLGDFGSVGDAFIVVASGRNGALLTGNVSGFTTLPPGQAVTVTQETGGVWVAVPCE